MSIGSLPYGTVPGVLASDQFSHLGFLVYDIDQAVRAATSLCDHRWGGVAHRELRVWTADGHRDIVVELIKSTAGDPPMEFLTGLEGTAGTPWDPAQIGGNAGSWHLHHLAYWSDDIPGDVERLQRDGLMQREATDLQDDGSFYRFAFMCPAHGPRIELAWRGLQSEQRGSGVGC